MESSNPPWASTALRVSIGVVYIWFGWPKLFAGMSPAEDLAVMTVDRMTLGLISGDVARISVGVVEIALGMAAVFAPGLPRLNLLILGHILGACAPLILFPDTTWHSFGVGTLEGQYMLKNILIATGVFVVFPFRSRASRRRNRDTR